MARRPIVGGNWKMNTTRESGLALARRIADGARGGIVGLVDVAVFPPFISLETVGAALRTLGDDLLLGAQDVYFEESGAFTGEVSTAMLLDVGCRAVLIGHSERRHILREGDDLVARKTRAALGAGLLTVLCVGETLDERKAGRTDEVNERQLRTALDGVDPSAHERLVVAYEPVWAIGTGMTATPDDAQRAHAHIRRTLGSILGGAAAATVRIQYGGSMKPANAASLLAQPDIDGGLIGGAALEPDSFLAICRAAADSAGG